MGMFPFTSARRFLAIAMKYPSLICALVLSSAFAGPLKAGYVVTISDGRESNGKISLVAGAVQVQTSSSPTAINFSEVLEADFGDTPFSMQFFSSNGAKGTELFPGWKGQDIGEVDSPGSAKAQDGVYTICGSGNFPNPNKKAGALTDRLFFFGIPWTGDGQWTARLKDLDAVASPDSSAGVMIRESLEPGARDAALETSGLGAGLLNIRDKPDTRVVPSQLSITPPVWLRLTRFGLSVFATVSTDKLQWDLVGQADFKTLDNPVVGLYAHTRREKQPGNAIFDDISFAPAPSSAQMLPPGVVLQGGSFVAATCEHLVIDPTNPDALGNFTRGTSPQNISASQISSITSIPLSHAQIMELVNAKPGLIMKNGDVMDGETNSITKGAVQVNSMLLGVTTFGKTDTRACVIHPLVLQPAKYEIRLKDGSMIHANDVTVSGPSLSIEDISGAKLFATMDDVAQFRAGSAMVQPLAELDWKAKAAPAPAPKTAPPAPAPAGGNAAAPALAPAAPDADQGPVVGSWRGPDEQQVLQADTGTTIDFPLSGGKYRAVAMRIMVSPDSPAGTQAIVHVYADGKEIATTPAFRMGEQPRFAQVIIQNIKTLSLMGESPMEGAKILFIDPVVIKN